MGKYLAERAKALLATGGSVITALLATGNLWVSEVNTAWPVITAVLTGVLVLLTPNAPKN